MEGPYSEQPVPVDPQSSQAAYQGAQAHASIPHAAAPTAGCATGLADSMLTVCDTAAAGCRSCWLLTFMPCLRKNQGGCGYIPTGCRLHNACMLFPKEPACLPAWKWQQSNRPCAVHTTLIAARTAVTLLLGRREHLRELLEAGDDDDWEVAEVDLEDDDNASLVEEVAANMADEDVDDFCDAMNQPEVQAIVQSYTNPSSGPVRGCTGFGVL